MKKQCLSLWLCFLICLLPLLNACGNGDTPEGSGTASTDTTEVQTEELPDLPENMSYGGRTFVILTAGNVAYNDFDVNEDSAGLNPVSAAQYRRLQTAKELYGVKIVSERKQNGQSYGNGPGYQEFAKAAQSGYSSYDLGIIGGYDVAALARNNFLYDLNALPYIDTSKSWWDENANEDLTIKGLLFFTNGDLTAAYSESTFAFYFNKELAKQTFSDAQDPYQLVKDGKWTIDKLGELSRLVSEDLNGDDTLNYLDRFGIYTWDDSMIGMVEAAGSKICTIASDGTVSLTLSNERTVGMINAYADFAYDVKYALPYQADIRAGRLNADGIYAAWGENKALFWASSTNNLSRIRLMDGDFGILPYPKLDEAQPRYYSTIAPYNSQFICVSEYVDDPVFAGSVTEALAYLGQKIVTPAVYEKTLKGIYARDEESYDMLDIIFGSYGYDLGLYYRIGMYPDALLNLLRQKSTGFASVYESKATAAETEVAELNENFAALIAQWSDKN